VFNVWFGFTGIIAYYYQKQPHVMEEKWDSRTSVRPLFKFLLCAPGRQAAKNVLALMENGRSAQRTIPLFFTHSDEYSTY
jgi:hypothetical protein